MGCEFGYNNEVVRCMRLLILLLLMIAGQVHACSGSWVMPDGRKCPDCRSGPCEDRSERGPRGISAFDASAIQDCHTCCSLTSCDDDEKPESSVRGSSSQVDFALISAEILLPIRPWVGTRTVHTHLEACYANAPPEENSPRAPPAQLN